MHKIQELRFYSMAQSLLLSIFVLASVVAHAQKTKYLPTSSCPFALENSTDANLPEGFNHPRLSHDGSKILVTKNYQGIYEVELNNPKKITTIADGEMDGFNMKWIGKNDDIAYIHSRKNNDGSYKREYHKRNLMLKSSSGYDITSISQPIQSLKSLTDDLIISYDFQNRKLTANNGAEVWDIATNIDFCVDIVLSPDKTKVAFDLFGRNYVYAINGAGKVSEFEGGLNKSWSPDGQYILYFKDDDKGTHAIVDSDLYISKADGTATYNQDILNKSMLRYVYGNQLFIEYFEPDSTKARTEINITKLTYIFAPPWKNQKTGQNGN